MFFFFFLGRENYFILKNIGKRIIASLMDALLLNKRVSNMIIIRTRNYI